jgi:serine protease AprX
MAGCKGVIILWMLSSAALAQTTNRYVVFFKDKNGTPYHVNQPQAFLSQKSLDRRSRLGIAVTAEDLPVTPSYVTQVKGQGTKTFFTSRWMNALLVESTSSVITAVAALPFVAGTQLVAPGNRLLGGRVMTAASTSAEATNTQLQMLGLDKMHTDGYNGEGIMISIFDAGFTGVNSSLPFQPIFSEGRLAMTRDFVTNSGNVYQFDNHGTKVFSVISGQLQGSFTGGAMKANYLLFVTEDVATEYRIEEYNWLFAAEKADSAGTEVIQSSLGYNTFDDSSMDYKISDLDGKTSVISKAAGWARDRGIIVVVSAGNQYGWQYVTVPADVDGILAVGAVNSSGVRTSFSSVGPTADGRLKPDVAALGQGVAVLLPDGSLSSADGTSLAAPLVTSLVAGLMQAYPSLKPSDLIQAIKLSASHSAHPDNLLGYGVPNYTAVRNYLESSQLTEDVYLFPNPATSVLKLGFGTLPTGSVSLTVYDLQGRQLSSPVITLDWLHNPVDISVTNLPAGMYMVRIEASAVIKTLRFVKF